MKPKKYVIAGTAGSGKTTLIKELRKRGYYIVPEVAELIEKEALKNEPTSCIRCGSCVDCCPMKLLPTELYKYIEMNSLEKAKEMGVLSCMECGSCSYVCPANIPLTQQFKIAKNRITKKE